MGSRKQQIPAINWQLCASLAGNKPAIAKEILAMFITELPRIHMQIKNDYAQKNFKSLLMNVHKLHGASCYCGVTQLKMILAKLEAALKIDDQKHQAKLLVDLDEEIKNVLGTYHSNDFAGK